MMGHEGKTKTSLFGDHWPFRIYPFIGKGRRRVRKASFSSAWVSVFTYVGRGGRGALFAKKQKQHGRLLLKTPFGGGRVSWSRLSLANLHFLSVSDPKAFFAKKMGF